MDTILLPRIDSDATMDDAIEVLKQNRAIALVTEQSSGLKVIDIDLILHTLRERGNVMINTVEPRYRVLRRPDAKPAKHLSNREMLDTQDNLDNQSAAYAVTHFEGGEAELLTRNESYRDLFLGEPDVWRCKIDANHVWRTSDLAPGKVCRYDGSPVDLVV